MRASKKTLFIEHQKGGKFLYERKKRQIKIKFVESLMPNLQNYFLNYMGHPIFHDHPYLFSKLPLSRDDMNYFVRWITRYRSNSAYSQNAGIHYLGMVDRTFLGTSSYATRRITLPILISLCDTLNVPIEAILFGTLNTRKIAHYNYLNYGKLPPIIHCYLVKQIRKVDKFPSILSQEPFDNYSTRKLAQYLGVSRTIADDLRTPAANKKLKECTTGLPNTKETLERYARVLMIMPEDILEVPVFSMNNKLKSHN